MDELILTALRGLEDEEKAVIFEMIKAIHANEGFSYVFVPKKTKKGINIH
jgi:hypothetical protein